MNRIGWLIFALVWVSCAWFGSWEWNANNATRLFAAISLVEDGDATIDEFAPLTIDKARFGDHFYLDKPPGMTLLAVPVVALADVATGERSDRFAKTFGDPGLGRFLKLRLRLATALIVAPLVALAAMLLFHLAAGWTGSVAAGAFAALTFGVGSPVWGWATTLLGHAPVAALYVIALYAVARTTAGPRRAGSGSGSGSGSGWAAVAGLALGGSVLIEHQALLGAIVIGLWGVWRTRGWDARTRLRLTTAMVAGGLPALVLLLGYNLLAFGTLFQIGYAGVSGFDGMKEGLYGLTWPKPGALLEIYYGPYRGLAWVAPVLVLAPFALVGMVRSPASRAYGILAAAGAATVLLLNAAYVYWAGGNSTGPRHAIPAIGFLAIAMGFRWATRPGERPILAGLLALSMAINLTIASAEIFAPENIRYPLWSRILADRFPAGDLRTWPGEWLGVSPWTGLALYLAMALPLLFMILRYVRRGPGLPDAA